MHNPHPHNYDTSQETKGGGSKKQRYLIKWLNSVPLPALNFALVIEVGIGAACIADHPSVLYFIAPLFAATLANVVFRELHGRHRVRPEISIWITILIFFCSLTLAESLSYFLLPFDPTILVPASDPDPVIQDNPNAPALPLNAFRVYMGNNMGWTSMGSVIALKIGQENLLTIFRLEKELSVSAKIFGPDGNIVAEIKNNHFFPNEKSNYYFRQERPDSHTLIVYDQQTVPVLKIRFLNPHSVQVAGVFRYADYDAVNISEGGITCGSSGAIASGNVAGNSPYLFSFQDPDDADPYPSCLEFVDRHKKN